MRSPLVAAAVCAALALSGCARGGGSGGRVDVVTGVYPLAFVAQRVGGEHVRVVNLAPPGAEPHDIELTPAQVGQVEQADVALLVHGLQPAVEDAARDGATLDALAVAGGTDPHVWLDPIALASVAAELGKRLGAVDAEHADAYRANAAALAIQLAALHGEAKKALARCARRDLVTSHEAFGRFTARYGLRQTGIAGRDDEAEPSPRRIADVVALVRERGVTTVFAESDTSKPAQTVAREAGVRIMLLDPVEIFRGDDYLAVMRGDIAAVRTALGCR